MNMGRYVAGIGFIFTGVLLYITNHAIIAAYGMQVTRWNTPPGRLGTAADEVSSSLLVGLSVVSLVLGVVYLIVAEVMVFLGRK